MARQTSTSRCRLILIGLALMALPDVVPATAQPPEYRSSARSGWRFEGIRLGVGLPFGNTGELEWYDPATPDVPFYQAEVDADPIYAWAPSFGLQVGTMSKSGLLIFAEFGYSRIRFNQVATLPGVGSVEIHSTPLHLLSISVSMGFKFLRSRLTHSDWAVNAGVVAQIGQLSDKLLSMAGASATAMGLSLSADKVVRRSGDFGRFTTLSPYLTFNLASHNCPKYASFGIAVRFHRR